MLHQPETPLNNSDEYPKDDMEVGHEDHVSPHDEALMDEHGATHHTKENTTDYLFDETSSSNCAQPPPPPLVHSHVEFPHLPSSEDPNEGSGIFNVTSMDKQDSKQLSSSASLFGDRSDATSAAPVTSEKVKAGLSTDSPGSVTPQGLIHSSLSALSSQIQALKRHKKEEPKIPTSRLTRSTTLRKKSDDHVPPQ